MKNTMFCFYSAASISLQYEYHVPVWLNKYKRSNKELKWNQEVSLPSRRNGTICDTRGFPNQYLSTHFLNSILKNFTTRKLSLTQYGLRVVSKDIFPSFCVYRAPNETQTCSNPPDAAIILNNNCLYCTMRHLLIDNVKQFRKLCSVIPTWLFFFNPENLAF